MAQNLFGEFDEVSSKSWKQKIQYELKGADYNDRLVWDSPEGIKVKPFYNSEDYKDDPIVLFENTPDWKIGQEIVANESLMANKKALDAVHRGVESLILTIPSEAVSVKKLLSGIKEVPGSIHFNLQFLSAGYAEQIQDFTKEIPAQTHLNIDILGHLARTGNWFYTLEKDHQLLEQIAAYSKKRDGDTVLAVDVSLYQNAGATIIQQLAYALANANEYLNQYPLHVSQGIVFQLAVGSNYFFEIAKIRALRLLWKSLALEYGITANCHILAVPTKRNKTLYDYNTNMLRTTTECMSGILAGADTVCNVPYDAIYHKDNEFGERIARNQLLLLKYESHFDQVNNAPEGSYYIEAITRQLAEKSMELFKSIELGGGFLQQLKNNTIQKKIKESAQKEQERFDKKEEILVGTNAYQDKNDKMKDDLEHNPFLKSNKRKTVIEPILEKRLAENMEQNRLAHE
ncbi:MAG: methylmalonyl-CoA mutase subunit beta [Maribacter sp.]|nr:methylmalonyl-CoA mutase subunit beta [Maribacter sp.]